MGTEEIKCPGSAADDRVTAIQPGDPASSPPSTGTSDCRCLFRKHPAALGDGARARNMTRLAEQTGMTPMGLYKALSGEGNPSYATFAKVAHALGRKISLSPV